MPMPSTRQTSTRQRGAIAIELALVSMLLATLMFGGLELGRLMGTYNEVSQSARAAARYLATSATVGSAEIADARKLVQYGSFATTTAPLAAELLAGSTQIQFCTPTYCDIPGKTTSSMTNYAVTGATTTNLVQVQVSGLQFISNAPGFVKGLLFRPISVYLPKAS